MASKFAEWLSDRWELVREAVGDRRYTIQNLVLAVISLVTFFLGRAMTPGDQVAIGVGVVLAFLLFSISNYAVKLRRERLSQFALKYISGTRPFETFLANARIPIRPDKVVEAAATFFSFSIENLNSTLPLKQVHVEIADVERHDGTRFITQGFGGPLHLQWEKKDFDEDRWSPRDIPPATTRFVNVVSVDAPTNRVWIKSKHQWQDGAHLLREQGVYRIRITVRPIEGAGKDIRLGLKWSGDWQRTEMWAIDENDPESPKAPGDPDTEIKAMTRAYAG